jgi:hypothetical protein
MLAQDVLLESNSTLSRGEGKGTRNKMGLEDNFEYRNFESFNFDIEKFNFNFEKQSGELKAIFEIKVLKLIFSMSKFLYSKLSANTDKMTLF